MSFLIQRKIMANRRSSIKKIRVDIRRRERGHVESYADAAAQIDLAVRNVRVLSRFSLAEVPEQDWSTGWDL